MQLFSKITSTDYPTLVKCFEEIRLDSGGYLGDNYYRGTSSVYVVPDEWFNVLPTIEKYLASMSEEDRLIFCLGEHNEQRNIMFRDVTAIAANQLFTEFFDDWIN